jgi:hypothetical protein
MVPAVPVRFVTVPLVMVPFVIVLSVLLKVVMVPAVPVRLVMVPFVAVTPVSEILSSRLTVTALPVPAEVRLVPPEMVRVSVKRLISTEPESPETVRAVPTAAVDTAVTNPLALTVTTGIRVCEPKDPTLEFTVANVVARLIEVISPVRFGMLVVVVAVPVTLPTKPEVAVTIPEALIFVELRLVIVPTVLLKVVIVPAVPVRFVTVPLVLSKVVMVPAVPVRLVMVPLVIVLSVKVETPTTLRPPDTLTSSSSVYPSTSKSPFASIAPANVEMPVTLRVPDTLTSSSSVYPSTSKSPVASIFSKMLYH